MVGRVIDPHDPKFWMTYEQAASVGMNIGFVLTSADPYFLYDIDECRVGDSWRQDAQNVCQMMNGAAMEVSQSGDGLHIIGRCDPMVGISRRSKIMVDGFKHEFYFHKRFIAFGKHGFTGDFNASFTNIILQHVPVKLPGDDLELTEGADPEYTGPEDDEELISMMLASRGSLGAQFGSKATIRELWEADAIKLAQVFPSSNGDNFDRSAADAALFSHLAFWTGRDLKRMDRLFRRSGLMREKYEKRSDYREWTVTGAAKGCRNVYNIPRPQRLFAVAEDRFQEEVTEAPHVPEALTATAPITPYGYMTPTDQINYFQNMIYIMEEHAIWVEKENVFYPPERFSAFFGGTTFMTDSEGKKPTKSAFEAFTGNTCVRFPRVNRAVFRPDRPTRERDGERSVNTYIPHDPVAVEGDVSLFLNHLKNLFATERDMMIVLCWFAAAAQHPDKRLQWAPVIQGVEGNGKSFLGDVLAYIVGEEYTHKPNAEDIANKFNDYIERKLLIIVEEAHMQGRREMMDVLKPLVTNERVEVQPKGGKKRMIHNWTRWIFFTNHKDAFPVSLSNRRYAIFYTRQQLKEHLTECGMDHVYFDRLWRWFKFENGAANICHYLKTMIIPEEYNPLGAMINAPITSSTGDAIIETMGSVEQHIMEAIETDRAGFRNGWISSYALTEMLKINAPRLNLGQSKRSAILRDLKYKKVGRATHHIFEEGTDKPTLYCREDIAVHENFTDQYCSAQKYQIAPNIPAPTGNVVQLKK